MSKGFTLIELLVVTGIIVIFTAMILPNYRLGDDQLAIQRSAHKISQDIRRAQEFAISAKEFNGVLPSGYGVYFNLNQSDRYVIFADLDGDGLYSGLNEKTEEAVLEGNVRISSFSPVTADTSLTVFFAPPDPTITFTPDASEVSVVVAVAGLTKKTQIYQYAYNGYQYCSLACSGASTCPTPRAACDTTFSYTDCPAYSFSASVSDPGTVYDWSACGTRSSVARRYIKTVVGWMMSQVRMGIQINKAGLIAVQGP